VHCTLLAWHGAGDTDPWLILTDLPPDVADVAWYGLRAWIEQGVNVTKRAGWQWQRTRMIHPDRAARRWLAIAVAGPASSPRSSNTLPSRSPTSSRNLGPPSTTQIPAEMPRLLPSSGPPRDTPTPERRARPAYR
jgi:hypothetical protein